MGSIYVLLSIGATPRNVDNPPEKFDGDLREITGSGRTVSTIVSQPTEVRSIKGIFFG